MKYLWLAVTPDKFELPIYVEDTAEALAKKLGVTKSTVMASADRDKSGKNSGRKIVKVEVDDY